MARGWKDTYEASRCDHCGAQVQRRTIAGTDERITLEAYRTPDIVGFVITAELEAKAGQCCGEAYRIHDCHADKYGCPNCNGDGFLDEQTKCECSETMRNTISNIR